MEESSVSLHVEIDEVLLQIMTCMQEIVDEKIKLQERLNMGVLNISRARYSMGNKAVGALQYPKEMIAETTTKIGLTFDEGTNVGDSRVRYRKGGSSVEDVVELKSSDPLRWFGILVPQSLRAAKSDFSVAISSVNDIAELQVKLDTLRNKYRELHSKKDNT